MSTRIDRSSSSAPALDPARGEINDYLQDCRLHGENANWQLRLDKLQKYLPQWKNSDFAPFILYHMARFQFYLGDHELALQTLESIPEEKQDIYMQLLKSAIHLAQDDPSAAEDALIAKVMYEHLWIKDKMRAGSIQYAAAAYYRDPKMCEEAENIMRDVPPSEQDYYRARVLHADILLKQKEPDVKGAHQIIQELGHVRLNHRIHMQFLQLKIAAGIDRVNHAKEGLKLAEMLGAKHEQKFFTSILEKPVH